MAAQEVQQFNNEGIVNLMVALIDDARKRYVKAIAYDAYVKKTSVKEEFLNGNWVNRRCDIINFVRSDPYGIFAPLTVKDVLMGWNRDAQTLVDEWRIRDELIKEYEKVTDYDEALEKVIWDFSRKDFTMTEEILKKYVLPAIRKDSDIKTYKILNELRKRGLLPPVMRKGGRYAGKS